jgi:hypothetical protein
MSSSKCVRVQISMPDELVRQVRDRVGRNQFSHYVNDAVAERLRHDLLSELIAELETEHGQVPDEIRAETSRLWPGDADG